MTKKHFIALADFIRARNQYVPAFNENQISLLADFCQSQNPQFNHSRWLAYIANECGPNGGTIKTHKKTEATIAG